MHSNRSATPNLVLERLPSGEPAWLRPETTPPPSDWKTWPRFVVQTGTVYVVQAPSAAAALEWFDMAADVDENIDAELATFGTVELVGQLGEDDVPETDRFWITTKGRRALAEQAS